MNKPIELARAKVNLSLHVLGRRADGYHDLESLTVFADIADELAFQPGRPGEPSTLEVAGETAAASGAIADNLVLKAAAALAKGLDGLTGGAFQLVKRLPVAAGLGGGSADAAAALRHLARQNGLAVDDPRVLAAALATGADCMVCLVSRPALMGGIGGTIKILDWWPELAAVLVNPRIEVPTRDVFVALALEPGQIVTRATHPAVGSDVEGLLLSTRNDLAPAARRIAPVIGEVEAALAAAGAWHVRMTGSGATVVGMFPDRATADGAAQRIARHRPGWWARAVTLRGSAT